MVQGKNVSQEDEAAQFEDGRGNLPIQRVVAQIPERERKNQRCEEMTMNINVQVCCLHWQECMYVCVYVCVLIACT